MSSFRIATLLLASALVCAACSAPSARLHVGYMQPSLSGNMSLAPSAGGGGATSTIDVEDSLGLTDPASSVQIRAELDGGPIRLTGSAFRYSDEGAGQLTANFGDLTLGTNVTSSIDLTNVKAALTFDLIDTGVFRLSPGLAVDLFQVETVVTETATGTFESIDELLPVPMLFAQAEVEIGPLSAVLDAGYLEYDAGESGGTYFDVEALVLFEPADHFEVFAGYRHISLDAHTESDGQDLTADLVLQGWFLGGGVRF